MNDHFSQDQFYNKDELFTSFSLINVSGNAVSWLAVRHTERVPLKTGRSPLRSDVFNAVLKMCGVCRNWRRCYLLLLLLPEK